MVRVHFGDGNSSFVVWEREDSNCILWESWRWVVRWYAFWERRGMECLDDICFLMEYILVLRFMDRVCLLGGWEAFSGLEST